MGEIADMVFDGTLCEQCGCFMDDLILDGNTLDDPPGYPRLCPSCRRGDKKRHKYVMNEWKKSDLLNKYKDKIEIKGLEYNPFDLWGGF